MPPFRRSQSSSDQLEQNMMLVGPQDECTVEIRLDGTFQAWVNSLLLFVQRIQLCVKDVVPKKNPVQNFKKTYITPSSASASK